MAIYVTVLLVIGAPLVSIVLTSSRATAENDTFSRVQERNRTSIFRIAKELRRALSGTAAIRDSGRSLDFTSASGFDGTAAVAGPVIRFTFRAENGETVNGSDDDGDGIADEGELVRTDLSTGGEIVVASAVDVASSNFVLNGTGVTINVTSLGSLDRRYGAFSVARNVTVYPRN